MIYIAALLFGMVHPGSKLLLESGLDLSSFCLLYIGFRFISQGLLLVRAGRQPRITRAAWGWLAGLGAVGAGLQIAEFFGISKGLPVPIVTFLVYTHPVWSLGLNRIVNHEAITKRSLLSLLMGLIGIALVAGGALFAPTSSNADLALPIASSLAAGLLIALWVSLAHRARSEGVSTVSLAFFYDAFAFGALLALRLGAPSEVVAGELSFAGVVAWLATPLHMAMILFYSIAVGVLPNMLFYQGQLKIGARAAGLVLLLEPVVSSLISHFVWHDLLSETFVIGSILILAAAVPASSLAWLKTQGLKKARVLPVAMLILFGISAKASVQLNDPPSTHGMLIFGSEHTYLSHLPMFHRPHDYQVLMEVQLDPESLATFVADQALHQEDGTFYTLVPETFVLPTVVSEMQSFHGSLYRGHFERGGTVIAESVAITIANVLDFEKLDGGAKRPTKWTGFVFGLGAESWIVHKIVSRPNFDEVSQVQRTSAQTSAPEVFTLAQDDLHPLLASPTLTLMTSEGKEELQMIKPLYLETGDLE